ncbi:dihydrofolate reductase [Oceaniglobus indicus]|uniref:dihydrofolate reductase n=1 Tax=Oceaniglobus indicus TaxID=2047749 RepID=UPI000C17CA23|nr:dihydrofolate reductase [Oceaniglobus indicus]
MLSLVVARARDGAIGKNGAIPWRAPEDLAFFQRETTGGALIMGRRTWESLPVKPLKNRLNLVVSSSTALDAEHVFADPMAAVAFAETQGHRRIYGIGGARIYAALMAAADRLLITEVDTVVPDADAYFPDVDLSHWRSLGSQKLRADDPACVLHEWLRR